MSIVASENAGLGPCELPDRWSASLSNTSKGSTSTTETGSYCSKSSNNFSENLVPISTFSTTNTVKTNTTFSSACFKATAEFGPPNSDNTCNLPHFSPAPATTAVTISNSATTVLGLVPSVPISTSVSALKPIIATASNAVGCEGANATSSLIVDNKNEAPTATVSTRFSSLQQQQAFIYSKNNSLLSINNLLPSHLQYQQSQQSSTVSKIGAALQRSVNMNAVASPISTNSTSNRKVRRKNDSKANLPQSQINKCNNEKRRRELENNYIEQLSEFLQLNKRGDMNSTKPDKAAILNQVVKTYRDICDRGQNRDISSSTATTGGSTASPLTSIAAPASIATVNNNSNQNTSTRCIQCATDNCLIHPVQQGDVSSTEPPLPEPSLLNGQVPEISAYFEALEHYISSVGWVLLQVNSAGIIESCTQNIRDLIGYEKQELCRQPLCMYLYPGDRAKLDPILNMSTSSMSRGNSGSGSGGTPDVDTAWNVRIDSEDPNSSNSKQERSSSVKIRMLVKEMRLSTQTSSSSSNLSNDNNSMDQNPKYEEVVLMAASVKDDSDSSSVLCLITRPEDESPLEMNMQQHVQHPCIEQVTFKLDIHGKIITLDATTLREPFKLHLSQWSGRLLQDLCHPQDLMTLKTHLRDIQDSTGGLNAINASQSPGSVVGINPPISNITSKPFRLRLGSPDIYVHVKANSRLFINSTPGESDFIMSVQTLLNTDSDVNTDTIGMMTGNSGQIHSGMAVMSPGSSLVSSLVSNLSMDTFVNTNSVSSPLINVSGMGGLVGGGGMPTNNTLTTNVGGPLMTSAVTNGAGSISNDSGGVAALSSNNSVINSQRTGYATAAVPAVATNNSTLVNSFAASPSGNEGPSFYSNEFDLDLPHSSFEMDPSASAWNDSRPNSRASVTTPVSTPRPPSAGHGFSPAICPSPSTPYQQHSTTSLSSPQSNTSQSAAGAVGAPGSISFGFQSFENNTEKNVNDNLNRNNNVSNTNNISGGSTTTNTSGNLSNGVSQLIFGNIGAKPAAINSQQKNEAQQLHITKPPTESERLRHLLTNKSHSVALTSPMDNDDIKLYKIEDDKESLQSNIHGTYKMGQNVLGHGGVGTSRMFGMQKSNSNNPMLLSLLKSEDDEKGGQSMGRSSEMNRVKDDHQGSHGNSNSNPNNLSPEDLRRILKHQGDPAMTRKRSLNDPDDGLLAKRSDDRPSKLCETNKMLASLLRNPPKNITMKIQTGIKIIPDKVPAAVGRSSTTQSSLSNATLGSCNTSVGLTPISNKSATVTAITGSISSPATSRGRGQQKQTIHTPSDVYLNQHQPGLDAGSGEKTLQRPPQMLQKSQVQVDFSSSPSTKNHSFATPPLNTTAPSTTATSTSSTSTGTSLGCVGDGDIELSKLLDSVMDYVSDDQSFTPTTPTGLTPQQINERMAISEIQKSLMVETSAFRNCPNVMIANPTAQHMLQQQMQQHQQHSQLQPPAYPGSIMTTASSNSVSMTPQQQQMQMLRMQQMLETMRANQNFQRPPPNYPARGRAPINSVSPSGVGVVSATQRYRSLAQQQIVQQQKERLLQQQQKQHMLVPENATARNDHMCLNPNIGTLLNTVAPNVTLSRTNMIPEPQLSPNFAQNMLQQQLSPGQRNSPFNTQSNSGYGQYSQGGQRLSPQQQASNQQQIAFQSGNTAQLSPRQPHFSNPVSTNNGSTGITSPGITPSASTQQWQTQSPINPQQRSHSLQQHNPMLSAQLQGVSPYNSRQYQQQRGRSLNSPGGSTSQVVQANSQGSGSSSLQRQNTFQANDGSAYTSTQSSSSSQAPFNGSSTFQQNQNQQMQRMQRSTSVSQSVQHMPTSNPASSDYVKQELRAVVSGRAAAAAIGAPSGEANISSTLRAATSHSPHVPQSSSGGIIGGNSTNTLVMTQQQQPHATITASSASNNSTAVSNASTGGGVGNVNNSLLNTPSDPTISFGFDSQDFFGSSTR